MTKNLCTSQLPRLTVVFAYFSLLVALQPAVVSAQTTQLDNNSLRQAVALWLGDDHDQAEVLGLLGPIDFWDTSAVTSFASLFKGKVTFTTDISAWNTSSVTDMSDAFNGCSRFDAPLDTWDFSQVQTTAGMFKEATQFDQDLTGLEMTSVTDMTSMFQGASQFKGTGLETWNVSNVRFMNDMFNRATNFNADVSNWATQSVRSMESMFQNAVSFNQDISSWNLQSIVNAENMFQGAMQFEQTLCWETLPQSAVLTNMFCDAHFNTKLDPCCVLSPSMIRSACCGGASGGCELNCGGNDEEQAVSNDNEEVTNTTTEDTTTGSPTTSDMENSAPTANNTTDTTNDNEANNLQDNQGGDQGTVEGDKSSSDKNPWQEYIWLRILVFVFIILLIGMIFINYLTRRSNNANRAAADRAENSGFFGKSMEKDDAATLEEVRTKESNDVEDGVNAQDCVIPKVTRIR